MSTPREIRDEKLAATLIRHLKQRHYDAYYCHDCKSPDSICNYVSIQRMSHPAGRHIVILVGEDLGY